MPKKPYSKAHAPDRRPDSTEIDLRNHREVLVHESALRTYLRRAFPVTDPDNVVQETFVRVLQAQRQGAIEQVRPYIFTTARHLALALMRRKKIISIEPITETEALSISTDEPSVREQVALKIELEILAQAIQSLPERCREVLTLRKIEGLSQREIATRLGISENTVEAQVVIGMKRCVEFFRQRGAMPPRKDPS